VDTVAPGAAKSFYLFRFAGNMLAAILSGRCKSSGFAGGMANRWLKRSRKSARKVLPASMSRMPAMRSSFTSLSCSVRLARSTRSSPGWSSRRVSRCSIRQRATEARQPQPSTGAGSLAQRADCAFRVNFCCECRSEVSVSSPDQLDCISADACV
jgi:hypothetical protein